MSDTITALATILRKAQGVENRETKEVIHIGAECVTIREEHDTLRAEIERLRSVANRGGHLAVANAEIERLQNANQDLVDERDIFARTLNKRDAEIERLTAAHDHQYAVAGTLLREAERANREIERLRGLLSDEVRPLLAAVAETQLWADRVSDKIQKAIEDE